ncbi:hypothetical protein [Candidatus Nanosynsacchari sp. TM7_ANC_38.39_G1_1]|uniref:hypothetical protein n=1 Tax=Candidatus Nanosynsacchari sp. TM7_ANC_38.39_G1_1 TaxID=1986206 RepID=UPI0013ED322A|nr:hypothetical protein [Candidatus Nanosynsacchari sp. TM7_ANC_38.39_G1_1]RYC72461.1 hypothetical protein G1ANC_00724 [Candidatus Nanosynsacchari sp. TM7_ANC_38.39_G1_1]
MSIIVLAVAVLAVLAVLAGVVVRRKADDDLTARVKALAVRARSADSALAEAEAEVAKAKEALALAEAEAKAAKVQADAAWELWGAAAKLLQKDNGDNPFKGSRPDKG